MSMVVDERRRGPYRHGHVAAPAWTMNPADFADGRVKVFRTPTSNDTWRWTVVRYQRHQSGFVIGGPRGWADTWAAAMEVAAKAAAVVEQ